MIVMSKTEAVTIAMSTAEMIGQISATSAARRRPSRQKEIGTRQQGCPPPICAASALSCVVLPQHVESAHDSEVGVWTPLKRGPLAHAFSIWPLSRTDSP
jgi:hypothetical protein